MVALRGVSKRFGSCMAVDHVDLELRSGSILGLIGENGAGKSTCMKLLYGLYRPDAGTVEIAGQPTSLRSPLEAMRQGIGMVHQHFMLVDDHTVLDNILIGADARPAWARLWPRALAPLARQKAQRRLKELAARYGLDVPLDARVGELPVGMQQRLEILKLLYRDAKVLILDEPTAVLSPLESQALFQNLKRLRDEGRAVVIITHKLDEVLDLCDAITVLRAGRSVGTADPRHSSPASLAALMVGHAVDLKIAVTPATGEGAPRLELDKVSHPDPKRLDGVSLKVRAGEIVGIAGVEGNGQRELIDAILTPADPKVRAAGKVFLAGRDVGQWDARSVKDLGVGLIPEDRHRDGLLLGRGAVDNCLLGFQRSRRFRRGVGLDLAAIKSHARQVMADFDVRPRDLQTPLDAFSGGNQQKLIIGRELSAAPSLILAVRPTRGVDVGAIEFIHRRLVQARDEGAAILLVSSDLDEIEALSDRILVMCRGSIVANLPRGTSRDVLGEAMAGLSTQTSQTAAEKHHV